LNWRWNANRFHHMTVGKCAIVNLCELQIGKNWIWWWKTNRFQSVTVGKYFRFNPS
jgi:hypothetical protein